MYTFSSKTEVDNDASRFEAPSLGSGGRSGGGLRLSREEMQTLGYRVIDTLVDHFDSLPGKSVTRSAERPVLEQRLREPPPEEGSAAEDVLEQVQHDIFGNMMHVDHPRFFAFIPSPSNFVSAMADALAAGYNVFSGTWLESSGPTEIELITVDWLRELCDMPETTRGMFVSGGTVANLTALTVARSAKLKDQIEGAVAYCSDQTHSSIDRSLRLLGFKPGQIKKLPSDANFRLSLPRLRAEVAADRAAGKRPFCVVANVGTTNSGAIDPLKSLVNFCRKEGLWLHADGAYGAAATLCDEGQALMKGLDGVDSLTLDPHKWMFQPHEMGCVLIREGQLLRDTFHTVREYTKDVEERSEEEVNFQDCGIQMTRGFKALKLWMSMKVFGLETFREAISRGIGLAELAEEVLRVLPHWEITTPATIGIVTFRYAPAGMTPEEIDDFNRCLVEEMMEDGFAMVSSTELKGRTVLRMCTNNPRTTEADIGGTIQRLDRFGRELSLRWRKRGMKKGVA